jgi:predicted S18 family serine protease
MINTSELRRGNWVYLNLNTGGELFCTVEEIKAEELLLDFEGVKTRESYIMVNPVGLSSEILERVGFTKADVYDEEIWFEIEAKNNKIEIAFYEDIEQSQKNYTDKLEKIRCYISNPYNAILNVSINNIQYLHQLQNLYFSLTGQELQVNLPIKANS